MPRSVLRTGSTQARELLVALAFGDRITWKQLEALALDAWERRDFQTAQELFEGVVPRLVVNLARVVALQNLLLSDRTVGYSLYRMLAEATGLEPFGERHGKLAADLAVQLGDDAFVERILAEGLIGGLDEACTRADMLNPFVSSHQDHSRWLERLNAAFVVGDVAPIALMDDAPGPEPFDRLVARPSGSVADGPLVSVVITTWCPGTEFISAFRSITSQTWQNLEILVIDDCSPADYQDFITSVVAEDPRARLLRMPSNGGTYVARNRGLREARGELFTVHDSDDWAHPERIERQVARMLAEPDLISTGSRALRLSDALVFRLPGVSASRENASSLTFWRQQAIDAIGYYDASRKGADTEYAVRLLQHFGKRSHVALDEHLACVRLTVGSLSREEFRPGWRHPARAAYRRGYLWWHEHGAARPGALRHHGLVRSRCFPEPLAFMPERSSPRANARRSWDVVYLFDARAAVPTPEGALEEMLELADAGVRVAVMHVESMLYPFVKEFEGFSSELQDLIARHRLGEVLSTDAVEIGTLVVRDPSSLQFTDEDPFPFSAARVLVVPDRMPQQRPRPFDCADVDANIRRKTGMRPRWLLPPGTSPGEWPEIDAQQRGWMSKLVSRHGYAAPRTGPLRFGAALRVACIAERATEASLHEWSGLGKAVHTRVWVLDAPDKDAEVKPLATSARIIAGRTPTEADLALADVVLLQGSPATPGIVTAAQAAIASGCVLLADEAQWAPHLAPCLLAPSSGVAAWLSDYLAAPANSVENLAAAGDWLRTTSGRNALIEQLNGKTDNE
jgi:hypothetical protein